MQRDNGSAQKTGGPAHIRLGAKHSERQI